MRYGDGLWGWGRDMGYGDEVGRWGWGREMGYEDGVWGWVWGEYGHGRGDVIDIEMGLVWG